MGNSLKLHGLTCLNIPLGTKTAGYLLWLHFSQCHSSPEYYVPRCMHDQWSRLPCRRKWSGRKRMMVFLLWTVLAKPLLKRCIYFHCHASERMFTTKFYMKTETYTIEVTAVEIISAHLSKRKLRGDLTQNYR